MSREKGEGSGAFGLAAGPAVPAFDCDETIPAAIAPKPAFKTSRRSNMSYRRKVGLEPIREGLDGRLSLFCGAGLATALYTRKLRRQNGFLGGF
jgi:hypothetical protein